MSKATLENIAVLSVFITVLLVSVSSPSAVTMLVVVVTLFAVGHLVRVSARRSAEKPVRF